MFLNNNCDGCLGPVPGTSSDDDGDIHSSGTDDSNKKENADNRDEQVDQKIGTLFRS